MITELTSSGICLFDTCINMSLFKLQSKATYWEDIQLETGHSQVMDRYTPVGVPPWHLLTFFNT